MEWAEAIGGAIEYIEAHLTEDITVERIAEEVHISPFYFQKGFAMLCGYTVMEYVRNRRLALAGSELRSGTARVIDVALKYGYDCPDSFAKAFARFHGATPAAVRKDGALLKSFAPLKIKIIVEGGTRMDYRIMEKDSFTVIGVSKAFRYENAKADIPAFWAQHYAEGKAAVVCGMYGINIARGQSDEVFDYMIADDCDPAKVAEEGFETRVIPALTWAVFPCKGAMPDALQKVNAAIYAEWLPACKEYEIGAGYCIEMYDDPGKYAGGTKSEDYYAELWIPVKKRA